MNNGLYYALCGALTLGVLAGIAMMSRVRWAAAGNLLSAGCVAAAIALTLWRGGIIGDTLLWICAGAGLVAGLAGAWRVAMIAMPQTVGLLNGLGGAASALVAYVALIDGPPIGIFGQSAAAVALIVGTATLSGSLVAAGKLQRLLPQQPVRGRARQLITLVSLLSALALAALIPALDGASQIAAALICAAASAALGAAFAVGVGGADMPITISLLNSLSGVAGAIAGMAVSDPLLVAVGGVVGASGLLLTRIMCRAMNRPLVGILAGGAIAPKRENGEALRPEPEDAPGPEPEDAPAGGPDEAAALLAEARFVIIVPGYGMALSQAQERVRELADWLERDGREVLYAIHPVAGRMPGHMNVLLCEVDVPYEKLREMDEINPRFAQCDVALIVGANDVINPAANTARDTPIYGMPVLDAARARRVILCNYDTKPGYAGVENPLYSDPRALTLTGDAKETLEAILAALAAHGA
ncbi:MAG: NAD(P)(+) transhydrogenase (Re/Si-specific) subunit beta [Clostridiales bacterium]|nr:NAD(P)(+) transhydrogenase (Re/Si-specific) subunit beta [Clostridiales bacterium]